MVKVTFREVECADMCVATLNGRMYGNRKISVSTWDGQENFKVEETAEEKTERLKKWEAYLDYKK